MPSEIKNKVNAVFGIIFSEDRKSVLMVKRRDFPLWVFPGGGIEKGETPEEACLRELEEETGFKCSITRKVCDFDHKKVFEVKASLFDCQILSGTPKITDESQDVSFFLLGKPPTPFLPLFKEFLDITLSGSSLSERSLKSLTWKIGLKFLIVHPVISLRFLLTRIGLHFNNK